MRLDHITPKQSALKAEGVDGEVDTKPKICESYKPLSRIQGIAPNRDIPTELLDDHRALEPPDPIPNSVVKRRIADGSVVLHHVRVGHRQAPIRNPRSPSGLGFLLGGAENRAACRVRCAHQQGRRQLGARGAPYDMSASGVARVLR